MSDCEYCGRGCSCKGDTEGIVVSDPQRREQVGGCTFCMRDRMVYVLGSSQMSVEVRVCTHCAKKLKRAI